MYAPPTSPRSNAANIVGITTHLSYQTTLVMYRRKRERYTTVLLCYIEKHKVTERICQSEEVSTQYLRSLKKNSLLIILLKFLARQLFITLPCSRTYIRSRSFPS